MTRDEETWSAEMNASKSSLPEVVESEEVLTVVFAVPWFPEAFASTAIAPDAGIGGQQTRQHESKPRTDRDSNPVHLCSFRVRPGLSLTPG